MLGPQAVFEPFYLFLVLATLGNIVIERSGVLNLGIDGFIVFSIALCYTSTVLCGPLAALLLVVLFGVLYSLLLSFLISFLHLPHVLTGLILNIIFYGMSVVVGGVGRELSVELIGKRTLSAPIALEWHHILLISVGTAVALWFFLYRTRLGIAIRACGFNPRAADYLGVRIWLARLLALSVGYSIIALACYVYTLFYKTSWDTYAGRGYGFLAIALAIASLWQPLIALIPVVLFSSLERLQYVFQLEYGIPQPLLSMIPYAVSVAFITAINLLPFGRRFSVPKALGEVYFKEERAA